MGILKNFEEEVLDLLVAGVIPSPILNEIKENGVESGYEVTGNGYFLTIRHPKIPTKRIVCDEPIIIGKAEGIDVGFVAFIEDREIMIECHGWGDKEIPQNFRDKDVEIKTT